MDAVLYTHPHADHIYGIDDLRGFNFSQNAEIPVFGNQWTYDDLPKRFPYIFANSKPGNLTSPPAPTPSPYSPPVGSSPANSQGQAPYNAYAIPRLRLHLLDVSAPHVDILGEKVIPLPVMHGTKECLGFRFQSLAYLTDCSYIPPSTMDRMKGLSVLILDCLRFTPHNTHFNFDAAMAAIAHLKPQKTYLTHLGHEFDYTKSRKKLPKGVFFAYDGLTVKIHEKGK